MPKFKKMIGEKCYLSPPDIDDVEKYCTWLNDLEPGIFITATSRIIDINSERNFVENTNKNDHEKVFSINDITNDQAIGTCGLHSINYVHRTAVLGIFIGDKNYWSKGFGEEAMRLLLDFGFHILNLHNITLQVYEFNKRAIRCYEKCGFQTVGRQRESYTIGGKSYDIIIMDILNREYPGGPTKRLMDSLQ